MLFVQWAGLRGSGPPAAKCLAWSCALPKAPGDRCLRMSVFLHLVGGHSRTHSASFSTYYMRRQKPPLMLFSRDPNTIFRGNSLTSKCIDETMKLAGMHYLHVTLKPTIEEVGLGPCGPSIACEGSGWVKAFSRSPHCT